MIGNRHVLVPELARTEHHVQDGVAPVTPRAVHVEVTANVQRVDQHRQRTALGSADLVFAFTKFRWNVREIEKTVEALFIGYRYVWPAVLAQTSLAEREPERRRTRLQPLRVASRAG